MAYVSKKTSKRGELLVDKKFGVFGDAFTWLDTGHRWEGCGAILEDDWGSIISSEKVTTNPSTGVNFGRFDWLPFFKALEYWNLVLRIFLSKGDGLSMFNIK